MLMRDVFRPVLTPIMRGIFDPSRSVSAAWSPAALWPAGAASPGLWIDPSYSASEWRDSAGTTALSTVGTVLDSSNPVGLVLDRKGGLALGAELVTNGDFATDTAWGKGANTTISGGSLNINTGSWTSTTQTGSYVAGKTYEIVVDLTLTSGYIQIWINEGVSVIVGSTGISRFRIVAGATTTRINIGSPGGVASINYISVREIPGLHLSQSTSAARPVASGRKNLLVSTATLSTQSVTVTAIPHTITFSGGGTVTASGTYTGALTSGQTFTPTAGTLTLTVSGSVTSAQLERGSAATTYQAVVSASDYTTTGFPAYLKFDGVDDALASATFAAGTLTSSMDCLIAVRRDSTAACIAGVYKTAGVGPYIGACESGGVYKSCDLASPTIFVDGVQLSGGTSVTAGTVHTALTPGAWHILEFRGLDLSAWTALNHGAYTGYQLNGGLGDILLFASGQDANRNQARAQMAAYFGVTLP